MVEALQVIKCCWSGRRHRLRFDCVEGLFLASSVGVDLVLAFFGFCGFRLVVDFVCLGLRLIDISNPAVVGVHVDQVCCFLVFAVSEQRSEVQPPTLRLRALHFHVGQKMCTVSLLQPTIAAYASLHSGGLGIMVFGMTMTMTMTHSKKSRIHRMKAWPYRQECRDHGPTKKNLFYW